MKKNTVILLLCSLILAANAANAAESVKSLLISALNAPDGKASGVVEGKEVDYIHAQTGATDPVQAEVSTVKIFANEPGCGRLALKLVQPNMPTKDGKREDFFMKYELNICKDGTSPTEGTDIGPPGTAAQLNLSTPNRNVRFPAK
jgi:hypothetical protein